MGRRTLQHRSREQNTEIVTKVRDDFEGEVSDLPANELKPENQYELINQVCYQEYCASRGAVISNTNVGQYLAPIPLSGSGTFKQSGFIVTATGGYTFTASDVGRLICFSQAHGVPTGLNSLVVKITGLIGTGPTSGMATVNISQSFTTAVTAYVRPVLNGLWWNDFNQMFIAHVGNVLYYANVGPSSAWNVLNYVGNSGAGIGNSPSYIQDLDQYVIVVCNGVWQIDMVNYLYFQANIDAMPNNLQAPAPITGGYNRKYLVTQSRLVDNSTTNPANKMAIFGDRTTGLTLQHESGSNQIGDTSDFAETGIPTPTGQAYSSLTVTPNLNAFMAQNNVYSIFNSSLAGGLLAGTSNGVYLSEDNAATWQIYNIGIPAGVLVNKFLEVVAVGFIFAATNKGVYMSTNGGDLWSQFALGSYAITSLAVYTVGANNTVYAGTAGAGIYSSDQTSNYTVWSACNIGLPGTSSNGLSSSTINDLQVNGIQLAASVAGSGVYLMNNGAINMPLMGIAYGNGTYVIVGGGGAVLTSTDLINWTLRVSNTTMDLLSVVYGGSLFVAVGGDESHHGKLITSPDGITWTVVTFESSTDDTVNSVCYGNSLFVAVGEVHEGPLIITSSNGSTWTVVTTTLALRTRLLGVSYINSQFVAVGYNIGVGAGTVVCYSSNGSTWTSNLITSLSVSALKAITYAVVNSVGTYVAVGQHSPLLAQPTGTIFTSTDLVNWSQSTQGLYSDFLSVIYSSSPSAQFVAVSALGQIVTSPDGVTWTLQTSGVSISLNCIAYVNSLFATVGAIGTILSCTNPIGASAWTVSNHANNWSYQKVICTLTDSAPGSLLLQTTTYGIPFDYQVVINLNVGITVGSKCTVTWQSNPNILDIEISSWNGTGSGSYTQAQDIVNASTVAGGATVLGNVTGIPWGVLSTPTGSFKHALTLQSLNSIAGVTYFGNSNNGLPAGPIAPQCLCFTPNATNIDLYGGFIGNGVMKFVNFLGAGASWVAANNGMVSTSSVLQLSYNWNTAAPCALALFAVTNNGVYYTTLTAISWNNIRTGLGQGGSLGVVPYAVVFSSPAGYLFLAASIGLGAGAIAGGIYKSSDGATWNIANIGMYGTYLCFKIQTVNPDNITSDTLVQFTWVPPMTQTNLLTLLQTAIQTALTSLFPTMTVTIPATGTQTGSQLLFQDISNSIQNLQTVVDADMPSGDVIQDQIASSFGKYFIDIGGALYLNGTSTSGGVVNDNVWKSYQQLSGITGAPDQVTHYSIYGTEDITYPDNTDLPANIVGNDPVAFAWRDDIPVMKAFKGTIQANGVTLPITSPFTQNFILWLNSGTNGGEGQFQERDIGRKISIVYTLNGGVSYKIMVAYVTYFVNSTQVYVSNFPTQGGTDISTSAAFYATIDARYLCVGTSYTSKQITVTSVFDTNTAVGAITAMVTQPTFFIGQQVFLSNGNICVIFSMAYAPTITFTAAYGTATVFAAIPINYGNEYTYYFDGVTDENVSPRIGTDGLATRFMRGMPANQNSATLMYVGIILPGFLVVANGQNYYWSDLADAWMAGNYNPDHQTDVINGIITALSKHADVLAIWTNYKVSQVQTNLAIDFTDEDNGVIVRTLPEAQQVESLRGVSSMACICDFQNAVVIAYLNDGSMRTFDGYTFGNDLILNKMKDKIKVLYNVTIDFFKDYGILLRGASVQGQLYSDLFIYVDTGFNVSVGCGKFNLVPVGEQNVHFGQAFDNVYMFASVPIFSSGDPNDRVIPGYFFNFFTSGILVAAGYAGQQDDYMAYADDVCSPNPWLYDILSSHTTGDDTGPKQHFYVEDMEGHVYLSPYVESDMTFLNRLVVAVSSCNDIGNLVTTSAQVSNNDDISFDTKIRGHRIRHKYTFSCAGWLMNGLTNYYKAVDKRTTTNSGDYESIQQAIILSPVLGISRYDKLINLGTGLTLSGVVTRTTGPDGLSSSAIQTGISSPGISIPCSIVSPCDFTLTFWFKLSSTSFEYVVQNGSNSITLYANGVNILVRIGPSGTTILSMPYDNNWHFIKISYIVGTILASVDNGNDTITTGGLFSALFGSTMILLATSIGAYFDLRLFSNIISNSQLTYYYKDVLQGGIRTLPLV